MAYKGCLCLLGVLEAYVALAAWRSGCLAEIGEQDLLAAELVLLGILDHGTHLFGKKRLPLFVNGRRDIYFRLSLLGEGEAATHRPRDIGDDSALRERDEDLVILIGLTDVLEVGEDTRILAHEKIKYFGLFS